MKEVDQNQITIEEAIVEATQKEQETQGSNDPCADCKNHTCDWSRCWRD